MTDFNKSIAKLAELEAKATPGEWWDYPDSEYPADEEFEQPSGFYIGQLSLRTDRHLVCALRNKALPLLREMQAENERLRAGIKDVAAKFAEMEKLRSQFYTEKEQAETALLFANRERDALQKRVDEALDVLKFDKKIIINPKIDDYKNSLESTLKSVQKTIGILTGEGEA